MNKCDGHILYTLHTCTQAKHGGDAYNPSEVGGGDKIVPRIDWKAGLATLVSSRLNERSYSQKYRVKEQQNILSIHLLLCTFTYTSYTDTQFFKVHKTAMGVKHN